MNLTILSIQSLNSNCLNASLTSFENVANATHNHKNAPGTPLCILYFKCQSLAVKEAWFYYPISVVGCTLGYNLHLAPLLIFCSTVGELLSAACEQGVAHPPGYPLWTMISSLTMAVLPFPPAYSVNMMTCATATLASMVLFSICHMWAVIALNLCLWIVSWLHGVMCLKVGILRNVLISTVLRSMVLKYNLY